MIIQNYLLGIPKTYVHLLGNQKRSHGVFKVDGYFDFCIKPLNCFLQGWVSFRPEKRLVFPSWVGEFQSVQGRVYKILSSSLFHAFRGPGFISVILLLARLIICLNTRRIHLKTSRSTGVSDLILTCLCQNGTLWGVWPYSTPLLR